MPWEPILDGGGCERARAAIDYLTEAVAESPSASDCSLAGGSAGFAVLFKTTASVGIRTDLNLERCRGHLGAAISALERQPLGAGLFDGVSGIGWAIAYCSDVFEEALSVLDELDGFVLNYVQDRAWQGSYDLVSGLLGAGVYGLQRGNAGEHI